ncbi:M16 family metallopeptidase [Azomonas macrocytogenes]|uniref:Zinc protease n=1 Tax=Azomonas macrocytogenes TaxID=69962 RepID=A0A839T204_AZOMA|nr:pitrilysin family protein [Azomonas macrocytogenes]MBB3103442.1 zinc protease [Azomonas macrocytogenes]
MIRPIRYSVALLLTAICLPGQAATNVEQRTHEFTLDNGLKVVVREDHRAPVVVSQLWYKVGSSFETSGLTGLSHMLEHMMFKGSKKLGPGEASRILRELGAEENAFTGADFTAYYQVLARDRLPVAFELEADRMTGLSLPPDEFKREHEVVTEERRLRTDDRPSALAFERFESLAYPSSGYRNPTIGWPSDLQRMTIDDARTWYQSWYAPNNATLVVVGDVQLADVRNLAEHYFGPLQRRTIPVAKQPLELNEAGERRLTLHVRTQLPSLLMAFNVPSLATVKDAHQANALRLLSALLDGGYSARLSTNLERGEELVSQVSAWYDAYTRGDTLFVIGASPNVQKNHTLAEVEAGIWRELDALRQKPPTQQELERVRAQVIAGLVYERDSITQQASSIGRMETVGLSWRLMDQELQALEAVTPEDIQAAANTFFTRSRMTLAHVLPLESKPNE